MKEPKKDGKMKQIVIECNYCIIRSELIMKTDKSLHYSLWSIAIIICGILSVLALIFAACSKTETKTEDDVPFQITTAPPDIEPINDPILPQETSPALPQSPSSVTQPPVTASTRLSETPDAGREYLDRIVFLGDSTTYGIGVYYGYGYTDLCPPDQVWTPASGTLTLSYYSIATIVYPETGEELTISDATERAKPDIMVITLGVNGISFMDEEWFIRDYTALVENIQAASPDTKIILNSIYPVAASYKYQKDINNDKIRAANTWIEQIAENTGSRFLNSYESLVGSDGYLPESMQNGDGLHLTGEAFGIVMNYLRTHSYY